MRGAGFHGDRIKMNAALRLDWKVFEIIPDDIGNDEVLNEIKDEIERRMGESLSDREGMTPFEGVYAKKSGKKSPRLGVPRLVRSGRMRRVLPVASDGGDEPGGFSHIHLNPIRVFETTEQDQAVERELQ